MARRSAGVLLFRRKDPHLEVLLAHPGGPLWAKKDEGAWSIPKGLIEEDEDPLVAAKREFKEETGFLPRGTFIELGNYKQPGGKLILAWAVKGDFDPRNFKCNYFSMPWPPKSGWIKKFPEIDRVAWFEASDAAGKITRGQRPIIEELVRRLEIEGKRSRKTSRPRRRVPTRAKRQ
jgi:predicted NUDIX family NTP pyrophosphohydrolase